MTPCSSRACTHDWEFLAPLSFPYRSDSIFNEIPQLFILPKRVIMYVRGLMWNQSCKILNFNVCYPLSSPSTGLEQCAAESLPQSYEKIFFGTSVVVEKSCSVIQIENKGRKNWFLGRVCFAIKLPDLHFPIHACVQLWQSFPFFIFEKSKLKIALNVGSITSCVYHTASSILLEVFWLFSELDAFLSKGNTLR